MLPPGNYLHCITLAATVLAHTNKVVAVKMAPPKQAAKTCFSEKCSKVCHLIMCRH
jgi:hypothetical protein